MRRGRLCVLESPWSVGRRSAWWSSGTGYPTSPKVAALWKWEIQSTQTKEYSTGKDSRSRAGLFALRIETYRQSRSKISGVLSGG
jgi:hypothetical protein